MFVQTLYEQLENTTHLCSWNVHTNSQGTDLWQFVGGPINIHHTDIGKKEISFMIICISLSGTYSDNSGTVLWG